MRGPDTVGNTLHIVLSLLFHSLQTRVGPWVEWPSSWWLQPGLRLHLRLGIVVLESAGTGDCYLAAHPSSTPAGFDVGAITVAIGINNVTVVVDYSCGVVVLGLLLAQVLAFAERGATDGAAVVHGQPLVHALRVEVVQTRQAPQLVVPNEVRQTDGAGWRVRVAVALDAA